MLTIPPTPQAPSIAELLHQQPRWNAAQALAAEFLLRTGREYGTKDLLARSCHALFSGPKIINAAPWIPLLSGCAFHHASTGRTSDVPFRLAGDLALLEGALAASVRTFCIPRMTTAFEASGKLFSRPVSRAIHTFDFLRTMIQEPLDGPRMTAKLARVNDLHTHYLVGNVVPSGSGLSLFRYITLNMFLVGPGNIAGIRNDEATAFHEIGVMVAQRMTFGRRLPVDVADSQRFVDEFERCEMFDGSNTAVRRAAIQIVHRSLRMLRDLPLINLDRVVRMIPGRVCDLLEIKR